MRFFFYKFYDNWAEEYYLLNLGLCYLGIPLKSNSQTLHKFNEGNITLLPR